MSKRTIIFSSDAWMKMQYCVYRFSTEVGMYGLVRKTDKAYEVYDILLYPQKVSAANIETDELKLGEWYDSLTDEQFADKRCHIHSHVDFGTFPSATDKLDQMEKIKEMRQGSYWIFLIVNKRNKYYARIVEKNEDGSVEDFETKEILAMYEDDDFVRSLANVTKSVGGRYESVEKQGVL